MQFFVNGEKVRYNPYNMRKDEKIGDGLEADVYKTGDKVVKFFKMYPGKQILLTKESVEKMKDIHTKRILLPTSALLDKKQKLRGYQMDFVENLGKDSYFNLNKDNLKKEHELLREDVELLSDNNILIEDLLIENTSFHDGIYLIDPGSYVIDEDIDSNQAYGINIDLINHYLLYEVLRSYHLVKHSGFNNYASYDFSREVNKEYNRSGKNDVLEFLAEIEEDNLSEFVDRRVNKH